MLSFFVLYAPQPALPASTASPYHPSFDAHPNASFPRAICTSHDLHCFHTHANASFPISFLLILMQTPQVWGVPSWLPNSAPRSLSSRLFSKNASLFATLSKERNASPFFPIVCALFAKKTGVYPSCSSPRGPFPRSQSGTRPVRPVRRPSPKRRTVN